MTEHESRPVWNVPAGAAIVLLAVAASSIALAADHPPVESPTAQTAAAQGPAAQEQAKKLDELPPVPRTGNKIAIDPSGRKESGKASIYSRSFDGKPMADGNRYNPAADVAASKTLPIGTVAKVTNLQSGKSTTVKIEDRGPFVAGRVVDLTPKAASKLGLGNKQGVAPVVVAPVTVPQPDGSVKLGAGAAAGQQDTQAAR